MNLANKKRNAPAPPPGTIYGTLPHGVRYQQNYDLSDLYNTPGQNNDTYSTLPHLRGDRNSAKNPIQFDNKNYDRFEPLMQQGSSKTNDMMNASKTSHKRSPSSDSITRSIQMGEFILILFKKKKSSNNLYLLIYKSLSAGAKLVLPTGEIPQLKPVDKNSFSRPRLPPPNRPNSGKNECHLNLE